MAEEQKHADQRIAVASRGRAAALQEAAFYRSKVAALEANSSGDVMKLERGRIAELERRTVDLASAKAGLERKVEEIETELNHHRDVAQAASQREAASIERAEAAEASYARSLTDYAELQRRAHSHESTAYEHLSKIAMLESMVSQTKAQHTQASARLATAETTLEQHLRTLEQTQITLATANTQASEFEALWVKAKGELEEQQEKVIKLESELEQSQKQLEAAQSRTEDLERALGASKEEIQSLRLFTDGHLSELVTSTRNIKARSAEQGQEQAEQLQALRDEADRHRSLATEAHTRATTAQNEAREVRTQHITLERQIATLRGELATLRTRHAAALESSSRAQALVAQRDLDLRDKARAIEAHEIKAGLLKSILAENGLSAEDSKGSPSLRGSESTGALSRKLTELEAKLEQQNQAHREVQSLHDEARQEAESSRQRLRVSEEQMDRLSRELETHKASQSDRDTAAKDQEEQKLREELKALQDKHAQLEATHLKAVQYVKG